MDTNEQTLYGIPISDIKSQVQYEGGTYITTSTYAFYVPNEVTDATSAVIYYPGSGGSGNDAVPIKKVLEENSPEQIIVIPNSAYEEPVVASAKYLQVINNIATSESVEIKDIQNYGFSAGARNAIQGIVNTIKSNPDLPPQKAVIIDAGYNCSGCYLSEEQINVLLDNEASLLFFEERNGGIGSYNVLNLVKAGVDVIVAWATNGHGEHVQINREVFANDIINYASGYSEQLLNSDIYTFMSFDRESGRWYEISLEEVAERFVGDFIDLSNPFKYYEKLSSIEPLESSNEFLGNKINSIRSMIKNTNFLNNTSGSEYESTTNIPNVEGDIVQHFFTTCSTLLNLLEKDTATIIDIGNSIEDLDKELAQEAEELEDNTQITPSTNQNVQNQVVDTYRPNTDSSVSDVNTNFSDINSDLASDNINKDTTDYDSSTNNSSPIVNNGNNVNSDNNSNIVIDNTSAIVASLVTSISKVVLDLEKDIENKFDIDIVYDDKTNISKEIIEGFLEYDELYSTDNMLVFDGGEDYKIVIHFEDGIVNGVEYYYDLGNKDIASSACELMRKDFKDIENIIQDGKYVKLTLKDDLYSDLKLEDLKEVYKDFRELKKPEARE